MRLGDLNKIQEHRYWYSLMCEVDREPKQEDFTLKAGFSVGTLDFTVSGAEVVWKFVIGR